MERLEIVVFVRLFLVVLSLLFFETLARPTLSAAVVRFLDLREIVVGGGSADSERDDWRVERLGRGATANCWGGEGACPAS